MKNGGRSLSRGGPSAARAGSDRRSLQPLDGERDPLHQTLHFLSNNIHSLSLRLFVAEKANTDPEIQVHLEAARRLAEESIAVLERINKQLGGASASAAGPERGRRAR
jgi:hypothetical protein